MKNIQDIRNQIDTEEFDYLILTSCLKTYKQPRDKITHLLRKEEIIRVKKGLYVFGTAYQRRPISLEVLSNLIYGPSYISFESALSYYNLIPERVTTITAASVKKNKTFETQFGFFNYQKIPSKVYPTGIISVSVDHAASFLIASKEKALCDLLARLKSFSSTAELKEYLVESMRIELGEVHKCSLKQVSEIKKFYHHHNVDLLWKILRK